MNKPLVRVPLKYGLFGSILTMIPFLVLHYTIGTPMNSGSHFIIDGVLLALFIFFALKEFKNNYNGGFLHFWQGMTIGFIIYLFIGLVYGLFVWVFVKMQSESFLTAHINDAIEHMKITQQANPEMITEEELKTGVEKLKAFTLPKLAIDMAQKTFIGELFLGLIISPIMSLILRKTPH